MSAPERLTMRRWVLDLGAMVALFSVPILIFWAVFDSARFFVGAYGALAAGLALASAGAIWRWGILVLAPATVGAYFVLGGALALPDTTIGGVIPTLTTLRELAVGAVTSWKSFLTTVVPVAVEDGHLLVPFATILVFSVVAGSLALRVSPPVWALLPVFAATVFAIVLGSPRPPVWMPYVLGASLVAVTIGWLAVREAWSPRRSVVSIEGRAGRGSSGGAGARAVAGALIVAVAAGLGIASQALAAPNEVREVARDTIVPPFELYEYASPLQSWRSIVRDHPSSEDALFTVSGLPEGARVRLAVLDGYDGLVYNVSDEGAGASSDFSPLRSNMAEGVAGEPVEVTVAIDEYAGAWLPDLGVVDQIAFGGSGQRADALRRGTYFNEATGTGIAVSGLAAGDQYTVSAVLPEEPTAEDIGDAPFAQVELPPVIGAPEDAASVAADVLDEADAQVEGALSAYARVEALEEWLRNSYFSHGLSKEDTGREEDDPQSRAGHGAQRIAQLLTADQRVGDDEQYAVAMALMARELGMPARVVMGFHADENDPDVDPFVATGENVHAWVEVAFEGFGWVAFDPTPPEDNEPEEITERPRQEPRPQVLQPPPPPQEPADEPPLVPNERDDVEEDEPFFSPLVWQIIVATGISLLVIALLLSPLFIIGALKVAKRRRRENAELPADRIAGGWEELVDRATDLGAYRKAALPVGLTRHEEAATVGAAFDEPRVTALAVRADGGVFAPVDPSDDEVRAYWGEVDQVVGDLRQKSTRFARLRARLSLRALGKNSPLRRAGAWIREKVAEARASASARGR
ncbi:transglutaminase domain-containing protein [Microbacterium excoecariae]|uniref:transglutaminase family protein n=1 Tax=Microbacterium excoecariae TaxID=2715210 RepID=UPI0014091C2F|nr:transglutaminase domain-containing protein [Microbacterium excoecariae]NHI16205.1 transglutaminase domain-containing protein [Microbacterium excoecariae]